MEDLIGRIAKLPDGTKVVIEKIETVAHTRRIEGLNEDMPAYIDVTKLEILEKDALALISN
jgi:hypothetical protein